MGSNPTPASKKRSNDSLLRFLLCANIKLNISKCRARILASRAARFVLRGNKNGEGMRHFGPNIAYSLRNYHPRSAILGQYVHKVNTDKESEANSSAHHWFKRKKMRQRSKSLMRQDGAICYRDINLVHHGREVNQNNLYSIQAGAV